MGRCAGAVPGSAAVSPTRTAASRTLAASTVGHPNQKVKIMERKIQGPSHRLPYVSTGGDSIFKLLRGAQETIPRSRFRQPM